MECPGKRWEKRKKGKSGYSCPWLPPGEPTAQVKSQLLSGSPPCLQCQNGSPLAPSGLGEVTRPPITSPEHITIFYLCGFSLLCELSNSPQSTLILRMPSVACWVSLIQISCQQFTLESYSLFLRKEGTDSERSEASTSDSVTEAS